MIIDIDDVVADTSRTLTDKLKGNPDPNAHKELLSDPNFWQSIPLVPGARKQLRELSKTAELIYATCRPEFSQTEDWLGKCRIPPGKIYYASGAGYNRTLPCKDVVISSLEPDFVVDDRPKLIPAAIWSSGRHYRVALFQQEWTIRELVKLQLFPIKSWEKDLFWTSLYDGTDTAWKELSAYLADQSKLTWV